MIPSSSKLTGPETIVYNTPQAGFLSYSLRALGKYDIVAPGDFLACDKTTATFGISGCNGIVLIGEDLPFLGHFSPVSDLSKVLEMISRAGSPADLLALLIRGNNDLGFEAVLKDNGVISSVPHFTPALIRDVCVFPLEKQIWIAHGNQRDIYSY